MNYLTALEDALVIQCLGPSWNRNCDDFVPTEGYKDSSRISLQTNARPGSTLPRGAWTREYGTSDRVPLPLTNSATKEWSRAPSVQR